MPPFKPALQGFEEFNMPEPNSGCWLWTAALNSAGYGVLQCGGYRGYAHRFAYETFKGPTRGLFVCHTCDTPSCVNPEHLFLGTQSTNMADCYAKGRHASQTGRAQYARGTAAARSKLTEPEIKQIRALKGHASQASIAELFCVTKTAIRLIHQGRTWSHV